MKGPIDQTIQARWQASRALTMHEAIPALIAAKWLAMLLCVAGAVAALGALSVVVALAQGLVDPGLPASPGALALLGGLAVQTIALTIYGGVALSLPGG